MPSDARAWRTALLQQFPAAADAVPSVLLDARSVLHSGACEHSLISNAHRSFNSALLLFWIVFVSQALSNAHSIFNDKVNSERYPPFMELIGHDGLIPVVVMR